jgi:putative heme iron utilization protein
MSKDFSADISSRICKHMNDDHADAIVVYAKAFGGITDVNAAQMLSIDAQGMDLTAQVDGKTVPIRIQFDHVLADAEDAHQTLIAMVKQARVKAN